MVAFNTSWFNTKGDRKMSVVVSATVSAIIASKLDVRSQTSVVLGFVVYSTTLLRHLIHGSTTWIQMQDNFLPDIIIITTDS